MSILSVGLRDDGVKVPSRIGKRKQQVFTTDEPKKQNVFTVTDEVKPVLNESSKKKEPAVLRKAYVKILLYCNHSCDHFYHKYDDNENCWCDKLDKCVALDDGKQDVMRDYSYQNIPEECPLQDV